MEKNIVTTIDGAGIVEAKNDRATFTLSLRTKNESLEQSKAQIKEKTSQVIKDLQNRKMSLDGDIITSLSNYKLEHREGGEKYPAGFQSISTLSWTVVIDNSLDSIYEACLKIDANMAPPLFSIKNRDVLIEQATQKAASNVKDKLNKECELLSVPIESLTILNWKFGYEGYIPMPINNAIFNGYGVQGATGPMGMIGTYTNSVGLPQNQVAHQPVVMKLGSIYQELLDTKLEPGTVSVRVVAQVSYIWK